MKCHCAWKTSASLAVQQKLMVFPHEMFHLLFLHFFKKTKCSGKIRICVTVKIHFVSKFWVRFKIATKLAETRPLPKLLQNFQCILLL